MPHATVFGIPVGIAGASLTLIFTVTTGVVKKILNITTKKKKKQRNNYEQMRDNIRSVKSINDLNKENDKITP